MIQIISLDKDNCLEINIYKELRKISVKYTDSIFSAEREDLEIEKSEIEGFLTDLKHLEETRKGRITFSTDDPRNFSFTIQPTDSLGHFEIVLNIGLSYDDRNMFNAAFEIDPSILVDLIHAFA